MIIADVAGKAASGARATACLSILIAGGERELRQRDCYRLLHLQKQSLMHDSVPAFCLPTTNERSTAQALSLSLH